MCATIINTYLFIRNLKVGPGYKFARPYSLAYLCVTIQLDRVPRQRRGPFVGETLLCKQVCYKKQHATEYNLSQHPLNQIHNVPVSRYDAGAKKVKKVKETRRSTGIRYSSIEEQISRSGTQCPRHQSRYGPQQRDWASAKAIL